MKQKYTVISITRLIICLAVCTVMLFAVPMHVHAEGGINSNEARVLAAARETFEYEGEMYSAKQYYVDRLIAQLSAEEVNLTSEQADNAISAIYANIENGVKSGYIVKVGSAEDDLDKEQKDEITETSPEEMEESSASQKPDGNTVKDIPKVDKNDDGSLTIKDGDGKVILQFGGVLKNTGFSYGGTVISIILLGVIISCVLIYSALVIRHTGRR